MQWSEDIARTALWILTVLTVVWLFIVACIRGELSRGDPIGFVMDAIVWVGCTVARRCRPRRR